MRVKYNTRSPFIPLFPLQISRFAVHPTATSEPAAGQNNAGHRNLNSSTYPDPGCHPFPFCLDCPPPACKGILSPMRLHGELRHLRNPFTPHRATA